jgi:uncharacterized protein (UPF0335 family)
MGHGSQGGRVMDDGSFVSTLTSADQLKAVVERIERLDEEIKG